jgi:hypothetical protein
MFGTRVNGVLGRPQKGKSDANHGLDDFAHAAPGCFDFGWRAIAALFACRLAGAQGTPVQETPQPSATGMVAATMTATPIFSAVPQSTASPSEISSPTPSQTPTSTPTAEPSRDAFGYGFSDFHCRGQHRHARGDLDSRARRDGTPVSPVVSHDTAVRDSQHESNHRFADADPDATRSLADSNFDPKSRAAVAHADSTAAQSFAVSNPVADAARARDPLACADPASHADASTPQSMSGGARLDQTRSRAPFTPPSFAQCAQQYITSSDSMP